MRTSSGKNDRAPAQEPHTAALEPSGHASTRWSSGIVVATAIATLTVIAGGLAGGLACGRRVELLGTLDRMPNSGGVDAAAEDAGSTAPRFSTPRIVAAVSDPLASDTDPTFTGDLLELLFTSDRGGTKDIWVSHRALATDPWGPPEPVTQLSSASSDAGPAISLDGLRVWFATDRDGSTGRIWHSDRPNRAADWAPPAPVAELAPMPRAPATDVSPAVDAVETLIMFASNRLGSAGFDIFSARRQASGLAWRTPALVPGINGPSDDWDPFVAQGGLVVFFTSMRQGAGDLFWAQRESITEPFSAPQPVLDLNSPAYDSDISLSPDLTYVLFDSKRSGNAEIYEAHATF